MNGIFSLLSKKSPGLWQLRQDHPLSAETNMDIDTEALRKVMTGESPGPIIRLFEWSEIAISYGYLMKEGLVREWASSLKTAPIEMIRHCFFARPPVLFARPPVLSATRVNCNCKRCSSCACLHRNSIF